MMNNLGKIIENSNLFPRSSKLLVAVSGGMDSMVLAHVLRSMNFSIGLAHVNYRLRAEDSDLDAELVNAFAIKNGLPLHLSVPKRIIGHSNLQEKARTIRYAFFEKIRLEFNYDYIVTAHHEDDVLESFIYNLTRGAGLKGLKSIQKVNGYYIRPLLNVEKDAIRKYAEQNHVLFREDKSNLSSEYDRNFIRNEIIPVFQRRFPSFKKMASRSIEHLKSAFAFFNTAFSEWKHENIKEVKNELHINFSGASDIYFITLLLADLDFHPETIHNILNAVSKPGSQFENKSGGKLIVDRNKLIYSLQMKAVEFSIEVNEKTPVLQMPIGHFYFHLESVSKARENYRTKNNFTALFDTNALKFPLIVRNWKPGDRVQPFGMKGKTKKVQDLFTDHKLNIIEKSKIPIVCSEDKIIWIPGIVRSNFFLVNDHTDSIFTIVWNPDSHELPGFLSTENIP